MVIRPGSAGDFWVMFTRIAATSRPDPASARSLAAPDPLNGETHDISGDVDAVCPTPSRPLMELDKRILCERQWQRFKCGFLDWFAVQIPLCNVASVQFEYRCLFGRLNPFRYDLLIKRIGYGYDRFYQFGVITVIDHMLGERLVDL